jgi:hypothetical protein
MWCEAVSAIRSELLLHCLILWDRFGCIAEIGEMLNSGRAQWVVCIVGCTIGGTLEGGVGTSATRMACGDRAGMVPHGMLLGAHGAGWLFSLA